MKKFLFAAAVTAVQLVSPALNAAEQGKKPILLVLSNHGELGTTGKPTGFFLSEASHPWKVFRDAGYPVKLGSPIGGFAPVDPKSHKLEDPANAAFWTEFGGKKDDRDGVRETLALPEVKAEDYAAVFFAGGHGAVWDFPDSAALKKITAEIYESGGAVGAVCHGPAALVDVKLSDGSMLVAGKKVAPFTNAEEKAVELTEVVPFLLEDKLKQAGATLSPGENFKENAVRDGRLVTGQNPASATRTAELVIEALKGK